MKILKAATDSFKDGPTFYYAHVSKKHALWQLTQITRVWSLISSIRSSRCFQTSRAGRSSTRSLTSSGRSFTIIIVWNSYKPTIIAVLAPAVRLLTNISAISTQIIQETSLTCGWWRCPCVVRMNYFGFTMALWWVHKMIFSGHPEQGRI